MDSRLLEYFLRVAEFGSINKAALDLQLSQSALSRHVASLEAEMGAELFTRTKGGVRLTESGQLLVDRARPLLLQFGLLKTQVSELTSGQLTIGLPQPWREVFTADFLDAMLTQYPMVHVRVYEGISNVVQDLMQDGLLDLCVVPFIAARSTGYWQTPLVREPLVLVGPVSDLLGDQGTVSASRLADLKLVLPGKPNLLRATVEGALARRGMRPRVVAETDTLALCLSLAGKGLGYTVVPSCALKDYENGDILSWAPVRGLYMTWELYENEARRHLFAVREGRRLALSTLASSIATGRWHGAEEIRAANETDASQRTNA